LYKININLNNMYNTKQLKYLKILEEQKKKGIISKKKYKKEVDFVKQIATKR
jgi:hypothetical protein